MMSSIDEIALSVLENAPAPDEASGSALRERAANVLRPAGALARLDDIAVWLASWQRTTTPAVSEPAVVVFVADHGVTTEGVSAYPARCASLGRTRSGPLRLRPRAPRPTLPRWRS